MKLSEEQIAFACEKREAGWSTTRIGKSLGVSSGAINYQCLKHGAVSPHQRATPTPETQAIYQGKDGRTFRTFTPDEDDRIMALATDGKSAREIATVMGRARTSIMMRIMLLELREEKL